MKDPQYLTEQDVHRMTKKSLSQLRSDRFLGKGIPYIKDGKSIKYNIEDVLAYMESRKIHTETM